MASRYSQAKPSRAGESFTRTRHAASSSRREVRFDVRNPSALAPDVFDDEKENDAEQELDDAMLAADVIGAGTATKRGAVNLDGYESDSENENFETRARARKKMMEGEGEIDIAERWDRYEGKSGKAAKKAKKDDDGDDEDVDDMFAPEPDKGKTTKKAKRKDADDDDDLDDMFAADSDEGKDGGVDEEEEEEEEEDDGGKKKKTVRFLGDKEIVGQDEASRDRSQIKVDFTGKRVDESESDESESEVEREIAEEGVDEEVGLGGLKRHAPRVEAFNMKAEQEEGAFDEAGNYVRKAADPDAVHDRWLEGFSKKDIKKAAAAHEKREEELRRQRLADADILTTDLLARLIERLERGETPLEALVRLGRARDRLVAKEGGGSAGSGKIPAWKLKKMKERERRRREKAGEPMEETTTSEAMETTTTQEGSQDHNGQQEQQQQQPTETQIRLKRIKEAIDAVTDAADRLLTRGDGTEYADVYDNERELLMRAYRRETGGDEWAGDARPREEVEALVHPETAPIFASASAEETASSAATADGNGTAATNQKMWELRWTDGRDGATQGPFDSQTMQAWLDAGYFAGGVVEFRIAGGDEGWRQVTSFV